jgi:hypothetical protein
LESEHDDSPGKSTAEGRAVEFSPRDASLCLLFGHDQE